MFLAFSFFLAAVFRDPFVPANLEQEPQIVQVEEVLLTSGDLSLTQYDVIVDGAEPILLSSKYFSGRAHDPNGGWSIVPHQNLILHTNLRKTDEGKHGKKDWISVAEPHGSTLSYYCTKDNRDLFTIEKEKASNLWQGKLSAKTNLCNQKIHKLDHDHFTIECADGGKRYYVLRNKKFEKEERRIYHLDKEVKPNGNRILYEYDNIGRIKSITSKSSDESKEYAWVRFSYVGGKWWERDGYVIGCKQFSIDTCDGRHFDYTFDEKYDETKASGADNPPRYLLAKVANPFQAETRSSYEAKQGKYFLKSCKSIGGHGLTAVYQGDKIDHLKAPVNGVEKVVSQFAYESQKTTVTDSLDGITTFIYDSKARPVSIARSHEGGSTSFHWVKGQIPDEKVRIKTFSDDNGKTVWARRLSYDSKGNVTREQFAGNLTGNSQAPAIKDLKDKIGSLFVLGTEIARQNAFGFTLHCKLIEQCEGGQFKYDPDFLEWDQSFTTVDGITLIPSEGDHWKVVGAKSEKELIIQPPPSFFNDFSIPLLDEKSAEVCTTHYKYDDLNRMTRMEEPNGRITLFSYLADTDLLSSRFTGYEKAQISVVNGEFINEPHLFIIHREFSAYDADRLLIRKVEDNGNGQTEDDYVGVTIRKIEKIYPHKAGILSGKPEKTEELYWDGKKECLLKRICFEYHPDGNVKYKRIYDTEEKLRYTLSYEYKEGRLSSETNVIGQKAEYKYEDEQKNRTYVKDFSGIVTIYRYNNSNQMVEEKREGRILKYRYDDKGRLIGTIDERENETTQILDPWGYLLEEHLPDGRPTIYTNDSFGNPLTKTTPLGHTTRMEYNARGQLTKVTHPDGRERKLFYSLDGQLTSEFDEEGIETRYIYDLLGNIQWKGKYKQEVLLGYEETPHNVFDGIIYHRDFEGNRTTYEYDGAGRKILEVCGPYQLKYDYDSLGRLVSIQNGNHLHVFGYDLLDRVIEEQDQDSHKNVLTKVQYEYDAQGNRNIVRKFIDGKVAVETTEYDAFSRPISVKDPYGHLTTIDYNTFINENGQKVLQKITTDPKDIQTVETFDVCNRLVKWERAGFTEHYEYDLEGKISRQYSKSPPVETRWTYDNRGRVETLTEAFGTPSSRISQYTYTPSGRMSTLTKSSGIVLTYTYDDFGYLKTLTSNDLVLNYTYTYDKLGRLKSATDLNTLAVTTRNYDRKGQLSSETLANGLSFSSEHDRQGRRYQWTLPNGSRAQFTYDDVFLKSITYANQSIAFSEYDLSGRCRKVDFQNRFQQQTSFDLLGRETCVSSPFLTQKVEEFDQLSRIAKLSDGRSFTYDDFGHLTSDNVHKYIFDPFGFRTAKDGEIFESNPLHQLPIEYDLDGNPKVHKDFVLTYDPLGRLIRLENKEETLRYEYDPLHRRIAKTTNGQKTLFLYDDQNEIGSSSSSTEIKELRILKPSSKAEMGASVLLYLNGQFYTPLHDLFGNIATLIDSSGQIAMSATYTPYGEEALFGLLSPWRYASKRMDPETQLINFGRRFYDPDTGRFITPDPKGFTSGLNLYSYVSNDPLHQFDPYGLEAQNESSLNSLLTISSATAYSFSELCIDYFPVFFIADLEAKGWNSLVALTTQWGWLKRDWRVALPSDVIKSRTIHKLFSSQREDGLFQRVYSDVYIGTERGLIIGSLGTLGIMKSFNKLVKGSLHASRVSTPLLTETISINKEINSKKIWTSTKKRTSVQNAFRHWKDHSSEFPELLNSKQYVEKSRNFFTAREKLLTKIRPNGEIIVYDAETNVFGVYTNEGVPKTMFKPTDGILYYERN